MHNIVVIRLSSLGDVALTAPVYRNLKAHWPGCRVTVLTKPQYAPLLEGHPCVDAVLPFRGLADALRRLRAGGFTHLLDLHANTRSLLLARFSRIPLRARYRKDALARRLFVALRRPSPVLDKHTVERYLEALAAWGVPSPRRSLELGDCRTAPQGAQAERVLVVQTAFLGDATLTLPLLRQLRKLLPDGRVTVLSRPETAELFRSSGWADEVLAAPKARGPGLLGLLSLARGLRAGRFDLAVIPHRSLRSALAAWLAGIPRRVGFSSSAGRLFLTHAVPFAWGMHDLERNLSLLLPLHPGLGRDPDASYLSPAQGGGVAERLLREAGWRPGQRLVGVHPGSVWPTKRWPAERYAELVRRLGANGTRCALVGGPGDAALTAAVARDSGAAPLDLAGKTGLDELTGLMAHLDLFVTNDSGPMHVAAACGVPVLAVFGPTTRELGFFPYGPRHRVLEAELACRPCGLHGRRSCPEGHFLCMRLISVEQVLRNALDMLSPQEALR